MCVGGRAEGKGVAPPYPQPLSFGVGQRDFRAAAAAAVFLRTDVVGMHPLRRGGKTLPPAGMMLVDIAFGGTEAVVYHLPEGFR